MSSADQETTITIVDDESVAVRFLSTAPDFFDRHPDILATLNVAHPESGDAVSLIERQVDVLRGQVSELEHKFQDMVNTARDNEALQERMHALMVALADASNSETSVDAATQRICLQIKQAFDIEYVTLKTLDDEQAAGYELAKARLAQGRCLCDDKMPKALLVYLFGEQADGVKSCALLPLNRNNHPFAMAALGAEDNERFSPDQGTLYLDRLAAMLSVVVRV